MIVILPITFPTSAARSVKITVCVQVVSGGIYFSITTSAWDDGSGVAAGQMQYSGSCQSFADPCMHVPFECFGIFSSDTVAVPAGPAKAQYDPVDSVTSGASMVVEINEDNVGSGDIVRVRPLSSTPAQSVCATPSGSFPGTIYGGNFNIVQNKTH